MLIGKVTGSIVATQKADSLVGYKLLIVDVLDSLEEVKNTGLVAVDLFGAGVGEKVLLCSGSSARSLFDDPKAPIDLVITGIIDTIETRYTAERNEV
jgi:ethanolamine utilization protein EutN